MSALFNTDKYEYQVVVHNGTRKYYYIRQRGGYERPTVLCKASRLWVCLAMIFNIESILNNIDDRDWWEFYPEDNIPAPYYMKKWKRHVVPQAMISDAMPSSETVIMSSKDFT